MTRKPYPSDVTDDEWALIAPHLTLMRKDATQREHDLREVFNGVLWIVRSSAQWRMLPNDLPPWHTVYQQAQRWIAAGVFEDMVHDLRALLRLAKGKKEQPSAAIFDGHKRKNGSKIHLGWTHWASGWPRMSPRPVNRNEPWCKSWRKKSRKSLKTLWKWHSWIKATREQPEQAARQAGIDLIVVKLPEAQKGVVLLPRRWVVERSFAWTARFRRLARNFERTPETLCGLLFTSWPLPS